MDDLGAIDELELCQRQDAIAVERGLEGEVEAVKAGKSVVFSTLADIIASLAKAERDGQLKERIRFLARLTAVRRRDRLPARDARHRGFAEWGEVFGDHVVATALLDQLLHHHRHPDRGIELSSSPHSDLVPENARARTAINAPTQ